jgi:hypothetical protein
LCKILCYDHLPVIKANIFPHPDEAEPDGLLAIGGDLSPQRLVMAYAREFFRGTIPMIPFYGGRLPADDYVS